MNITNIKPAKIEYTAPDSGKFNSKELKISDYKEKPNAFLIRTSMLENNLTQRETARLINIPWNRFQSWIMPCRSSDAPNYILKKLKQELEI